MWSRGLTGVALVGALSACGANSGARSPLVLPSLPSTHVVELVGGVTPGFAANGDPRAPMTGSDGRLWFADAGGVERLNPDATVSRVSFPSLRVSALAAGAGGRVWFAGSVDVNRNRLVRLDPDGTVTPTPPEGLAEYPSGIAVNADGRVWITGRPWSSPPVLPPPDPKAAIVAVYGDGVLKKYAFETISGWPADLVDRTVNVDGTPTKTVTFPGPILADPDGRIWFGACTVTFPSGANGRRDGSLSVLEGALGGPNRTLSVRTVRTGACPEGLAYPHSTLWFTEPGAYAIGSVDKRLLTKPAVVSTDLHPTGPIVAAPSGIWFAGKTGASGWLGVNPDPNHEGLGQLHPDGSVSAYLTSVTPGFNGSGVDGLTVGPDGNVWFTEAGGAGAVAQIQLGIASGKKQR